MKQPKRTTDTFGYHPTDNHTKKLNMENDQAEIYDAVMQYRMEEIDITELYMFCQSFNRELTYDGLIESLGRYYYG